MALECSVSAQPSGSAWSARVSTTTTTLSTCRRGERRCGEPSRDRHVALLWARHPTASVGEVRQALLSGVDRRPSLVGRTVTGGRLNARRALEELAR